MTCFTRNSQTLQLTILFTFFILNFLKITLKILLQFLQFSFSGISFARSPYMGISTKFFENSCALFLLSFFILILTPHTHKCSFSVHYVYICYWINFSLRKNEMKVESYVWNVTMTLKVFRKPILECKQFEQRHDGKIRAITSNSV